MNGNQMTIIVILVLVIFGGWFFLSSNMSGAPSPAVTNQMPVVGSTTPEMIVENPLPVVTIIYGDQFSPKSVTVPLGTTVEFVDRSPEKDMWVASAKHPDHTVYSGTSLSQHCPDTANSAFDQCSTSTSYSFTFNKVGTWNYHNHVNASDFGTVVVTSTPASSTPQLQ